MILFSVILRHFRVERKQRNKGINQIIHYKNNLKKFKIEYLKDIC